MDEYALLTASNSYDQKEHFDIKFALIKNKWWKFCMDLWLNKNNIFKGVIYF